MPFNNMKTHALQASKKLIYCPSPMFHRDEFGLLETFLLSATQQDKERLSVWQPRVVGLLQMSRGNERVNTNRPRKRHALALLDAQLRTRCKQHLAILAAQEYDSPLVLASHIAFAS
jgi:hypothetical protein